MSMAEEKISEFIIYQIKSIDKPVARVYNIICSLAEARAISSVGQSNRLITGWSGVRVPDGPPVKPAGNILPVFIFLYLRQTAVGTVHEFNTGV